MVAGVSAALLHGLAVGTAALPCRATFIRPGAGGGSTDLDVMATRLPGTHVREVDGTAVCSVARTVVDIARRRDAWHGDLTATVVADSALRQATDPMALRQEIDRVIDDLRGCLGMASARSVLREATELSAGPAETVSRVLLRRMGMPAPLLDVGHVLEEAHQAPASADAPAYHVPFNWPAFRLLGIVLDRPGPAGGVPTGWTGDRDAWEAGPRRRLREQGWCVVEWSSEELAQPWLLGRRLSAVIRETGFRIDLCEVFPHGAPPDPPAPRRPPMIGAGGPGERGWWSAHGGSGAYERWSEE